MGIFKYLLWLAPVLIVVLYYITTTQKEHEAKMYKDTAIFDRDFAMSRMGNKENWSRVAEEKEKEIIQAKKDEELAKAKADKVYKQLEDNLRGEEK